MMLKEWDKDAEEMSWTDLCLRLQALQTLKNWPAFNKEYGWTGFRVNADILLAETDKRKRTNSKLH